MKIKKIFTAILTLQVFLQPLAQLCAQNVSFNNVSLKQIEKQILLDGKMIRKWNVRNDQQKIVILLQDVHRYWPAQNKNLKIINRLAQIKPIALGLEGASGQIEEAQELKKFPRPDILKKVAYVYARGLYLSGAEAALLSHLNSIEAFGLEDSALYQKQTHLVRKFYKQFDLQSLKIKKQKQSAVLNSKQYFSPQLRQILKHRFEFKGSVSWNEAAQFFFENCSFESYPNMQVYFKKNSWQTPHQMQKLQQEQNKICEQLLKVCSGSDRQRLAMAALNYRTHQISLSEYQDLLSKLSSRYHVKNNAFVQNYWQDTKAFEHINFFDLYQELLCRQDQVLKQQLTQETAESKNYYLKLESLTLAQKALDFSLTPQDWKAIQNSSVKVQGLDQALNFAELSDQRSQHFTKIISDNIKKHSDLQIFVIVSGAFHSQIMAQKLAQKNVQVWEVCPWFNSAEIPNDYSSVQYFKQSQSDSLAPPIVLDEDLSHGDWRALSAREMLVNTLSLIQDHQNDLLSFIKNFFEKYPTVSGKLNDINYKRILAPYPFTFYWVSSKDSSWVEYIKGDIVFNQKLTDEIGIPYQLVVARDVLEKDYIYFENLSPKIIHKIGPWLLHNQRDGDYFNDVRNFFLVINGIQILNGMAIQKGEKIQFFSDKQREVWGAAYGAWLNAVWSSRKLKLLDLNSSVVQNALLHFKELQFLNVNFRWQDQYLSLEKEGKKVRIYFTAESSWPKDLPSIEKQIGTKIYREKDQDETWKIYIDEGFLKSASKQEVLKVLYVNLSFLFFENSILNEDSILKTKQNVCAIYGKLVPENKEIIEQQMNMVYDRFMRTLFKQQLTFIDSFLVDQLNFEDKSLEQIHQSFQEFTKEFLAQKKWQAEYLNILMLKKELKLVMPDLFEMYCQVQGELVKKQQGTKEFKRENNLTFSVSKKENFALLLDQNPNLQEGFIRQIKWHVVEGFEPLVFTIHFQDRSRKDYAFFKDIELVFNLLRRVKDEFLMQFAIYYTKENRMGTFSSNSVAAKTYWDKIWRQISGGEDYQVIIDPLIVQTLEGLNLPPELSVLELGAGRGELAELILNQYSEKINRYDFIEPSQNSIQDAQIKLKKFSQVYFHHNFLEDIALDRKANLIIASGVLTYQVMSGEQAMRNLEVLVDEKLSPGGYVIITGKTPVLLSPNNLRRFGLRIFKAIHETRGRRINFYVLQKAPVQELAAFSSSEVYSAREAFYILQEYFFNFISLPFLKQSLSVNLANDFYKRLGQYFPLKDQAELKIFFEYLGNNIWNNFMRTCFRAIVHYLSSSSLLSQDLWQQTIESAFKQIRIINADGKPVLSAEFKFLRSQGNFNWYELSTLDKKLQVKLSVSNITSAKSGKSFVHSTMRFLTEDQVEIVLSPSAFASISLLADVLSEEFSEALAGKNSADIVHNIFHPQENSVTQARNTALKQIEFFIKDGRKNLDLLRLPSQNFSFELSYFEILFEYQYLWKEIKELDFTQKIVWDISDFNPQALAAAQKDLLKNKRSQVVLISDEDQEIIREKVIRFFKDFKKENLQIIIQRRADTFALKKKISGEFVIASALPDQWLDGSLIKVLKLVNDKQFFVVDSLQQLMHNLRALKQVDQSA